MSEAVGINLYYNVHNKEVKDASPSPEELHAAFKYSMNAISDIHLESVMFATEELINYTKFYIIVHSW